jgi:hypothetical protein
MDVCIGMASGERESIHFIAASSLNNQFNPTAEEQPVIVQISGHWVGLWEHEFVWDQ